MCVCVLYIYINISFNTFYFFCGTYNFVSARLFLLFAKSCRIFLEPFLIPLYPQLITFGVLMVRNKWADVTKDFSSTIHAVFVLLNFGFYFLLCCEFFCANVIVLGGLGVEAGRNISISRASPLTCEK